MGPFPVYETFFCNRNFHFINKSHAAVPFPACRVKGTPQLTPKVNDKKGCMTLGHSNLTNCSPQNLFFKNRFHGFHIFQFDYVRVMHPLHHSLLECTAGCPFLCMQKKGNAACGWIKIEIHFSISGLMDCKWSNLNAPGSYTPWCYSLLGSLVGCPFHSMQGKGSAACGLLIKWKFLFQK